MIVIPVPCYISLILSYSKAFGRTETTIHLFILEPGLPLLTPVNFTSQMGGDVGTVGHHQMQTSHVGRVQLPDVQAECGYLGLQVSWLRPRAEGLPVYLVGAMTTNKEISGVAYRPSKVAMGISMLLCTGASWAFPHL